MKSAAAFLAMPLLAEAVAQRGFIDWFTVGEEPTETDAPVGFNSTKCYAAKNKYMYSSKRWKSERSEAMATSRCSMVTCCRTTIAGAVCSALALSGSGGCSRCIVRREPAFYQ